MKLIGLIQIVLFCLLSSSAWSSPMTVFVSIPPEKWLSDLIGGDLVETHVLVDKGQEPHSFEPTPRQVVALSGAGLYFTVGMDFERTVVRKLNSQNGLPQLVDLSRRVQKIPMDQGHIKREQRKSGMPDPHIWLSPLNLKVMAIDMAAAMAGMDPQHAVEYEANRDRLLNRLDRLHASISADLAPFQGRTIHVFHPAFGYFAKTYHLLQRSVEVGGKSPTPRQLASFITAAKAEGVKVIFVQPQFDPRSGAAIARGIGGRVVPLDSLAEDVEKNLKRMAKAIKEVLGDPN